MNPVQIGVICFSAGMIAGYALVAVLTSSKVQDLYNENYRLWSALQSERDRQKEGRETDVDQDR